MKSMRVICSKKSSDDCNAPSIVREFVKYVSMLGDVEIPNEIWLAYAYTSEYLEDGICNISIADLATEMDGVLAYPDGSVPMLVFLPSLALNILTAHTKGSELSEEQKQIGELFISKGFHHVSPTLDAIVGVKVYYWGSNASKICGAQHIKKIKKFKS